MGQGQPRVLERAAQDRAARAGPHLPISPLYLTCISPIFQLYLAYISPIPLEQANAELQAELDSSKERLGKCKDALGMLDAKVVELRDDFSKRTAEAEALKVSCRGDAREM